MTRKGSILKCLGMMFVLLITFSSPMLGRTLIQEESDAEASTDPEEKEERILVLPLSDEDEYMVDQVQAEFLIEKLKQAEEQGFTQVILKLDTYGGVVISARDINNQLLAMKIPVTAYVETKAISAGAFIAWACNEIVMQQDTTIGDAQMIYQTQEGIEEAPEKAVTVYRSDWKKACRKRSRSFAIAQGFFDAKLEVLQVGSPDDFSFMLRDDWQALPETKRPTLISVVCKKDQLLTLLAEEAQDLGLVTVVANFDAFLKSRNIEAAQLHQVDMSFNQKIMRFIGSNSWLFYLITIIGLNGIYMELKAPGFGIPGFTALVCFTLVFGTNYLLGTANLLEIMMFVAGLGFCALEIFVLPGIGVAAIAGMGLMFAALVLASFPDFGSLPSYDFQFGWLRELSIHMGITFVASFFSMGLLVPLFLRLPFAQRHMLQQELRVEEGYVMKTVEHSKKLIGFEGVALGDLRPIGKAKMDDGRLLDVSAGSHFVADQTRIKIVRVDGNIIVVRPQSHEHNSLTEA